MTNRRFFLLSALGGLVLAAVITLALTWTGSDLSDQPLVPASWQHRPDSYYAGIQQAAPAVVSIYSSEIIYREPSSTSGKIDNPAQPRFGNTNRIAPLERHKTSQGSGVIISEDGYVLTNNHLVQDADNINVALADGRLFLAQLIGADTETDLAVIKIDSPELLPSCSPDNDATLMVGDIVLAIGNPFGVGQTVTQGIVSATSRHISGASRLQNFIQIDAAINPGNSGGALINPKGELVGINTAVFSQTNAQGIGFAIPADLIRVVVPEIIEYGRVFRGWLGVGAENLHLHPDLYRQQASGAVVSGVFENSPAHVAGLRRLDVITELNDQKINSATDLMQLIASKKPGSKVQLRGFRQTVAIDLAVILSERPAFDTVSE